jgi:hypothetical protein
MQATVVRPGVLAVVPGTVLAGVFGLVAVLRRRKPLHPDGRVAAARLVVEPDAPSGCEVLDVQGDFDCVVRASYAMGTGPEGPDIEGFALRLLPGERLAGPADVLFASTGSGPLGRFVLQVRRPGHHGVQTTLLPVEAGGHPLLLRLLPRSRGPGWPADYDLEWTDGGGPWRRCARLTVDWDTGTDEPIRFDPVTNELPGTRQYPWVRWLREPAYLAARLLSPHAGQLRAGRSPSPDGAR